jgi:CubicO group peptidase (beta-lactamase class C family)
MRLKRCLACLPFLISCASPQPPDTGVAPASTIIRDDVARRIDRYLTNSAAFGFSGAVLVADSLGVVLRKGYGFADVEHGSVITPDMVFDMGSIVKHFTAAAILLLESDGKLRVTDSLGRFFPEAPADKANITLHQVLTHTAGLISDVGRDYAQISRDSMLKVIWDSPLLSVPGQRFNYSNAGYSLLAALIEKLSGKTYEQFLRERVFLPSGMRETGYHIPALDTARVAHTYTQPVDHGDPATRLAQAQWPLWNLIGGGGILTTVDDLYRHDLSLRRGSPITPAIQAKLFAEQFRRTPTLANGYDWWIEPAEDGGIQYNRAGDGPSVGVSSEWRRYPSDGTVFILLANNRHHGGSTRRFVMSAMRRLYVGAPQPIPPAMHPVTSSEASRITGTYRVDSTSFVKVSAEHGRLILSGLGQSASNLLIASGDTASLRARDDANSRMLVTIRALATQDTAAATSSLGSAARARRLLPAWIDAEGIFGPFKCVEILGTDRLDRGVLLTSARLHFRDSTKTVRSVWNGNVPNVNSDDAELVNDFGFTIDSPVDAGVWSPYWYVDGDTLMTYDLATADRLAATVVRDATMNAIEIVFDGPAGRTRATRVVGEQTVSPKRCLR